MLSKALDQGRHQVELEGAQGIVAKVKVAVEEQKMEGAENTIARLEGGQLMEPEDLPIMARALDVALVVHQAGALEVFNDRGDVHVSAVFALRSDGEGVLKGHYDFLDTQLSRPKKRPRTDVEPTCAQGARPIVGWWDVYIYIYIYIHIYIYICSIVVSFVPCHALL